MKECSNCMTIKDDSAFSKKQSSKDGLQPLCKICQSEYIKRHYSDNKKYYKDKAHSRNKEVRIENLQFVIDYLKSHPCVDCGETDPLVLEFDHLRDKYKEVSRLVRDSASITKIQEEIDKCEVRCCNCHRRKTIKQFGWYKGIQI